LRYLISEKTLFLNITQCIKINKSWSGLLSYCNVNLYRKISSYMKKLNNILWNINVLCLLIWSYLMFDIVNIFYVIHMLWNIIVLYLLYLFISSFHVYYCIFTSCCTYVFERCLIQSWNLEIKSRYIFFHGFDI
jgi:hypothetical protein